MNRVLIVVAVIISCLVWGCGKKAASVAWIDMARTVHKETDQALEKGELDSARQNLIALVSNEEKAGMAAADRRVVMQDSLYRLAEIELEAGRPKDALTWTERGIAMGDSDDLFVANLYVSQARALERLGNDEKASQSYHRALLINESLLNAALDNAERTKS